MTSKPYLSAIHDEIKAMAANYPPKAGTEEWSTGKVISWQLGLSDIFAFKGQWVGGYKDAINAAAERFDLPAGLVAGVAYTEVGGDPAFIDDIAYSLRSGEAADRTSFGNVSMQVRRGAETLGYDPKNMSQTQRREVLSSLNDAQTNIFMAAKHLSDLRDRDYPGVGADKLSKEQVEVIATRFNRGSESSLDRIKADLDYGRDITKRWDHIQSLIK